jgi:hypothetical protein
MSSQSIRRRGMVSLARAVLNIAMTDRKGAAGFSTCPARERPKWKRDAQEFFLSGRYKDWADMAGMARRHVLAAAEKATAEAR